MTLELQNIGVFNIKRFYLHFSIYIFSTVTMNRNIHIASFRHFRRTASRLPKFYISKYFLKFIWLSPTVYKFDIHKYWNIISLKKVSGLKKPSGEFLA